MAPTKQIVLVTGGNTGLGYEACLHIATQPNTHLILTGRDAQRVHDAANKVRTVADPTSTVEEGVLDLGSLGAVRTYCEQLLKREDLLEIAAILCNAGVQVHEKKTTVDGLEVTFGVNHLGHFLLATLLRERTKRLVMISSETHDPAEKTSLPAPNVSDLEQLAVGYPAFNGAEAYSTSKLCNLLFMTEWIHRFPNGAECIAYTPGFTPDSELYRNATLDLSKVLDVCKSNNISVSTSAISGAFMGRLTVEDWAANGWKSGQYIRVDHVYHTSPQAQDPELAAALWDKSEQLVKRLMNN